MVDKYEIYTKSFTPKLYIPLESQRTGETKEFSSEQITLQVEGENNGIVAVRGKYPNDDFFGKCKLDELIEV